MNCPPHHPPSFYNRPSDEVAQDLLGDLLLKKENAERIGGTIVETEAYLSTDDDANHALQSGKTERTRPMFGPPGTVYVYLIYGMYHCLNVTCKESGTPEAVLIRSIRPERGVEKMISRREANRETDLPRDEIASGPGKLCMALGIDRSANGSNVCDGGPVTIHEGSGVPDEQISKSPRVGVDYAENAADWPLRFRVRAGNGMR